MRSCRIGPPTPIAGPISVVSCGSRKAPGLDSTIDQVARQRVRADQMLRQPVEPADAGNTIRAAAADRIRNSAAGAAEFGADSGALQIHFSDIEFVHFGAEIAERGIRDVRAVDQVRVVLSTAASGGPDVASIVGDAWDQLEQSAVRALERKAVERIGFEVEADLGRPNIDDSELPPSPSMPP